MLAQISPSYLLPGPESSLTLTGGSNSAKPVSGWGVMAALATSLEGLTRGIAQDLKPVRVNLVSPGALKTEVLDDLPKPTLERILESARTETLGGAIGQPEDLAEAYLYVMKDRFITETVISSDGGRLLM